MESTYSGWVLMPSMKPVELTFVDSWGFGEQTLRKSQKGQYYRLDEIFKSKADAVKSGFDKLAKLEEDLVKRRASIDKRKSNLEKYID